MEGKVIYPTSDEKLVNAVVLFAGTEDWLFYDETLSKPVTTDEALNLFKKGLILVSVDGGFKRPTGITVTEFGYEISYGDNGGSGAEDFVVTFIQVEDTDDWISNKTFVEISDAIESGKNVIGSLSFDADTDPVTFSLSLAGGNESLAYVFCGLAIEDVLAAHAFVVYVSDEVTHWQGSFLPEIKVSDDGNVLTVREGSANWESLSTD